MLEQCKESLSYIFRTLTIQMGSINNVHLLVNITCISSGTVELNFVIILNISLLLPSFILSVNGCFYFVSQKLCEAGEYLSPF